MEKYPIGRAVASATERRIENRAIKKSRIMTDLLASARGRRAPGGRAAHRQGDSSGSATTLGLKAVLPLFLFRPRGRSSRRERASGGRACRAEALSSSPAPPRGS